MLLALAWLLLRARKGKNNRCGLCSVGDVLLASLILFIPGFFLVRSFGYSRIESLCFAPFASALVITLLCFSYSKIGIETSFISLPPLCSYRLLGLLWVFTIAVARYACGEEGG